MKYLSILSVIFLAFACEPKQESAQVEEVETHEEVVAEEVEISYGDFGDTINEENIQSIDEVMAMVEENGTANVKITGEIEECCQKKGCWMKVSVEGMDDPIRVTFKDYGFFVPKNSF